MVTVSDFLAKLGGIDVKSLTATIIKENQEEIVDLNREDQIFQQGIDAKGQSLLKYSKATQKFYDRDVAKGVVTDTYGSHKSSSTNYNLFWTGETYKRFIAYMQGMDLIITTNSRGQKLLTQNGGSSIFGLTPQNAEIANWKIIGPKLSEKIRNILL